MTIEWNETIQPEPPKPRQVVRRLAVLQLGAADRLAEPADILAAIAANAELREAVVAKYANVEVQGLRQVVTSLLGDVERLTRERDEKDEELQQLDDAAVECGFERGTSLVGILHTQDGNYRNACKDIERLAKDRDAMAKVVEAARAYIGAAAGSRNETRAASAMSSALYHYDQLQAATSAPHRQCDYPASLCKDCIAEGRSMTRKETATSAPADAGQGRAEYESLIRTAHVPPPIVATEAINLPRDGFEMHCTCGMNAVCAGLYGPPPHRPECAMSRQWSGIAAAQTPLASNFSVHVRDGRPLPATVEMTGVSEPARSDDGKGETPRYADDPRIDEQTRLHIALLEQRATVADADRTELAARRAVEAWVNDKQYGNRNVCRNSLDEYEAAEFYGNAHWRVVASAPTILELARKMGVVQ